MAGISLPLRRLLGSRSILAQSAGYAIAGLSMAGPWLLTALGCADSFERTEIGFLKLVSDCIRSVQVLPLLLPR